MAKDVAWNCPYRDGVTKPTAAALERHMGDHHRAAMRATIDAGLARADKKLDAINRKRALASAKKKKSGPKRKPAQAKTARALEEHAAAFNTSTTTRGSKRKSKGVRVRPGSEDARMAEFSREFIN